jgi:hypothetical protein
MAAKNKITSTGTQAVAVMTGSFLTGKRDLYTISTHYSYECTGAMVCLSGVAIPVFLDTTNDSTLLLQQWLRTYHYGHIYMPALAVGTTSLYTYIALGKLNNSKHWSRYLLAGATTIAMVPFTWVFMSPTNNTLFKLEETATAALSVADLRDVRVLLGTWSWLHMIRSIFPLVGTILGFTGLLRELGL